MTSFFLITLESSTESCSRERHFRFLSFQGVGAEKDIQIPEFSAHVGNNILVVQDFEVWRCRQRTVWHWYRIDHWTYANFTRKTKQITLVMRWLSNSMEMAPLLLNSMSAFFPFVEIQRTKKWTDQKAISCCTNVERVPPMEIYGFVSFVHLKLCRCHC